MGNGHSSSNKVITAGPNGSSNGITLIKDWTTSNHPSSKGKPRRLCNGITILEHGNIQKDFKLTKKHFWPLCGGFKKLQVDMGTIINP